MRWLHIALVTASVTALLAGCQAPLPEHLSAFDAIEAALREAPELRPVYAQADSIPGQPVGTAPMWRIGLQEADGHAHQASVYAAGARQDLGFGKTRVHTDGAVILHDLGPSEPAPVITTRGALDSNEMGPASAYWLDGQDGGRWRLDSAAGAAWYNLVGAPIATPPPPPTAWEALAPLQTSGIMPANAELSFVHGRETRGGFVIGDPVLLVPPDQPFDGRAQYWRFNWNDGDSRAAIWAAGRMMQTSAPADASLPHYSQLIDSSEAVRFMQDTGGSPLVTYELGGGATPRWSAQWLTGDVIDGPSVPATQYAMLGVTGHVFEEGPEGRPVCDAPLPHLNVEAAAKRVTYWRDGPDQFPEGTRFAAWQTWRVVEENPTGCGTVNRFTGALDQLRTGWPGSGGDFLIRWDNRLLVDGIPFEPGQVRGVQISDEQVHGTTEGPQSYTYTGSLTLTHLGWWPTAGVTPAAEPLGQ